MNNIFLPESSTPWALCCHGLQQRMKYKSFFIIIYFSPFFSFNAAIKWVFASKWFM